MVVVAPARAVREEDRRVSAFPCARISELELSLSHTPTTHTHPHTRTCGGDGGLRGCSISDSDAPSTTSITASVRRTQPGSSLARPRADSGGVRGSESDDRPTGPYS